MIDILLSHLHDFFKIKHITNYNTANSKYKLLTKQVKSDQKKILHGIDKKIIKTNLEVNHFIGMEHMKFIHRFEVTGREGIR